MTETANRIWVLADPRAGTAAQAIGIAERLGRPFRTVALEWGPMARLPLRWPTLAGLAPAGAAAFAAPWPDIAISAGRRSAPVALWLAARVCAPCIACAPASASAVSTCWSWAGTTPAAAPNILPILGATHRMSPARLAAARAEWGIFDELPGPRIALLLGGPPRARGDGAPTAAAIAASRRRLRRQRAGHRIAPHRPAGGIGRAEARWPLPHHLHRWGDGGPNPYAGMLAWADAVVVTGDSVSMLSEALATAVPVFIADPGGLGARHHRLHASIYAAGQALAPGGGAHALRARPVRRNRPRRLRDRGAIPPRMTIPG